MATFELYTDKRGEFRFRLKADNGQIILASEGYTMRASARTGIASVKKNAKADAHYQRKKTASGWSFNLRAANNKVIGTSEVYNSEAACEGGIASVKKNAPSARVLDA